MTQYIHTREAERKMKTRKMTHKNCDITCTSANPKPELGNPVPQYLKVFVVKELKLKQRFLKGQRSQFGDDLQITSLSNEAI